MVRILKKLFTVTENLINGSIRILPLKEHESKENLYMTRFGHFFDLCFHILFILLFPLPASLVPSPALSIFSLNSLISVQQLFEVSCCGTSISLVYSLISNDMWDFAYCARI